MNRIDQAFQKGKAEGRPLFIAYIMGGDPDLKQTQALVLALEKAGVDIVELGVPFSDPIADGVVNQAASQRALAGGVTLKKLLDTVASIRKSSQIPIVLFSYLNPIIQYGNEPSLPESLAGGIRAPAGDSGSEGSSIEKFSFDAAKAGVDGVLIVDLPPEEAAPYVKKLEAAGLKNIFLLAPTTPKQRAAQIAKMASGFIYYVSRLGVTGVREKLDVELETRLRDLKREIRLPLAVGFGISSPDHVRKLSTLCDAIVVGSAIVQKVEEGRGKKNMVEEVSAFVRTLTKELTDAKT